MKRALEEEKARASGLWKRRKTQLLKIEASCWDEIAASATSRDLEACESSLGRLKACRDELKEEMPEALWVRMLREVRDASPKAVDFAMCVDEVPEELEAFCDIREVELKVPVVFKMTGYKYREVGEVEVDPNGEWSIENPEEVENPVDFGIFDELIEERGVDHAECKAEDACYDRVFDGVTPYGSTTASFWPVRISLKKGMSNE